MEMPMSFANIKSPILICIETIILMFIMLVLAFSVFFILINNIKFLKAKEKVSKINKSLLIIQPIAILCNVLLGCEIFINSLRTEEFIGNLGSGHFQTLLYVNFGRLEFYAKDYEIFIFFCLLIFILLACFIHTLIERKKL